MSKLSIRKEVLKLQGPEQSQGLTTTSGTMRSVLQASIGGLLTLTQEGDIASECRKHLRQSL
jgi:hypothetical protein